jgi:lipid-binding SYLF domain-containing protein
MGRQTNPENGIMRMLNIGSSLIRALLVLVVAAGTGLFATMASAADGTINLTVYKAGFIVGGSGGEGTLTFEGKKYPVSIGGVSLGATIGVSKAELIGEVKNIKQASDIEGVYSAVQAGVAVAGGGKVAELKNSKGVVLKVKGKEVGLELALDLSGMEIKLKK